MIQRVPGGVLACLREAGLYEPSPLGRQGEPLPGTGRDSFRAPRSPGDAASLPFGVDDLDRFDPAPHAAASHRPRPRCVGGHHAARGRPRCVGGHHAARGRERAGGRVGREAQAKGSRGGRQLAPRDGGTGPQPPARPVGRDPVESLAQVHDDALPDAPARHPAPRTPRHEPGARRCRPPHELLQLLHAPRHGDRCRDDPIDPGAFRVCGSAANIGQESRLRLRQPGCVVRGTWFVTCTEVTTHHPPRTIHA